LATAASCACAASSAPKASALKRASPSARIFSATHAFVIGSIDCMRRIPASNWERSSGTERSRTRHRPPVRCRLSAPRAPSWLPPWMTTTAVASPPVTRTRCTSTDWAWLMRSAGSLSVAWHFAVPP
jgi:hypothetical protein